MTNHLMIAFDDLFNYRDFLQSSGKWGMAPFGIEVPLPNLARLEARSTLFRRASAVVAVCAPSRAAILSGFSPPETGIFDLEDWTNYLKPEHLWTHKLRRAGYYMGTVGKIFHGYVPQKEGVYQALYDTEPFQVIWNPSGEATEWGGLYGKGWDGDEDRYYDSMVAKTTTDFLLSYRGDKPFHWECGFHHPHNPWYAPNRIFAALNLDDIIMPADWPLSWDILPFPAKYVGGGQQLGTPSPGTWDAEQIDWWKKSVRNYIAAVVWADEKLGEVLDALEASPFNDDTLITCWSDHGYHLGDKGVWHKFTLWEESCNAPFLISAPGQTTPREVWQPVSLVDLGATVCDYLGIADTAYRRSVSIRPLVEGETMPERMILSYHYGSVSGAIGDWRVTAYQDGSCEYYNVMSDPWLTTNLAEIEPGFAEHLEMLLQTSREWGLQVVEEGATVLPGTPMASYLGWEPSDTDVTASFVIMGDMDTRAKSPGYQKVWIQNVPDWTTVKVARIPAGAEDVMVLGSFDGSTLIANDLDNKINFRGVAGKDRVLYLGAGDDLVRDDTSAGRMVVYGGSGNDTIIGSSGANWLQPHDRLFGGTGDDFLDGGSGNDYLVGGAGNDTVIGGVGNDTIIADAGSDVIDAGIGNDRIEVTGGSHNITTGSGADVVVVMRTGQPQVITDLSSSDTLDLSDWAGIQPVLVRQVGASVEITAGLERITCQNTTVAAVRAVITGATTTTTGGV